MVCFELQCSTDDSEMTLGYANMHHGSARDQDQAARCKVDRIAKKWDSLDASFAKVFEKTAWWLNPKI
jgi:hypothetical protein